MRTNEIFIPLYEINTMMHRRADDIKEGVPNPNKLLAALRTFIKYANARDLGGAVQAMVDMGLTQSQIEAVESAYNKTFRMRGDKSVSQ